MGGWEFIYLHIKQSHVHLLVQTKNLTGALLEVQECVVIGEVFQEKEKKVKKKANFKITIPENNTHQMFQFLRVKRLKKILRSCSDP